MDSQYYHNQLLNWNDYARIRQTPSLADKLDWRVSRVLKQRSKLINGIECLSHRKGYAVLSKGLSVEALGVDMEVLQQRDFTSLAQWVATDNELGYLKNQNFSSISFYLLWTIKEALLKAENLQFPDDMRRVGIEYKGGRYRLFSPYSRVWKSYSVLIDQKYLVSTVWVPKISNQDDHIIWHGLNNSQVDMIHIEDIFR